MFFTLSFFAVLIIFLFLSVFSYYFSILYFSFLLKIFCTKIIFKQIIISILFILVSFVFLILPIVSLYLIDKTGLYHKTSIVILVFFYITEVFFSYFPYKKYIDKTLRLRNNK